ncbi:4780_t:CDS:2 [Racocetra fulgida]|uniref:4780_t:CDS:1 n=1 Tax=Racocetra fulgida TaxID=60492 RepID=A0A9N9C4F9_9GLOM|nr:4780_t:CDS:2 [Racocetra fulgida]
MPPTKRKNKNNNNKPSNNGSLTSNNEITNLKNWLEYLRAENERLQQSQQPNFIQSFNNIHYSENDDGPLPLQKKQKIYKKGYERVIDSSDSDPAKNSDCSDFENDYNKQLPEQKKQKSYKKKIERSLIPLTKKLPITNIAPENITPENITPENVTPETSNNIMDNQQKETSKNRRSDSPKETQNWQPSARRELYSYFLPRKARNVWKIAQQTHQLFNTRGYLYLYAIQQITPLS